MEKAPHHQRVVPQLRKSLAEFWKVVDPLPVTMVHASNQEEIDFLDREIVPRRGELYNALRALTLADEQKLEDSAGEFADARRRAGRGLLAMLALGVLLSFLVARLSLRHAGNLERKAELHFAEVEHARHELKQLSARLLEIEEEGRRRLSRELHDEIGQTLALLQIEISHAAAMTASAPEAQCGTAGSRARSGRAHRADGPQYVRHASPGAARRSGPGARASVPARGFHPPQRHGLRIRGSTSVAEDLPDAVKTCVYRVVQEALHNSEKHSGATKVKVSVRQFPDRLVAEIEDNGCGFSVDDQGAPAQRGRTRPGPAGHSRTRRRSRAGR